MSALPAQTAGTGSAVGILSEQPAAALRLHEQAGLVPAMSEPEFSALVAHIDGHGILEPLAVTADGVVLDGRSRLQAARVLRLLVVPVRLITPADQVEYMLAAALERRNLTPGQRAALALEREEYRAAKRAAEQRRGFRSDLVAPAPTSPERSREVAARMAGVGARTVQDVISVRAADPALFAQVKAGEVPARRAAQRVRRQQRHAELVATPRLPQGPFQLVYADPPWQLGSPSSDRAVENHYPTLSLDEIKALPVPAADDAVCFLWVVNQLLPEALQVLEAWGFRYRTNFVWVKDRIGLGFWARGQHELLLLGTRGRIPLPAEADRPSSLIDAPRREHSAKPEQVYGLIERTFPGFSRVELFARQQREGWVAWGNELPPADEGAR